MPAFSAGTPLSFKPTCTAISYWFPPMVASHTRRRTSWTNSDDPVFNANNREMWGYVSPRLRIVVYLMKLQWKKNLYCDQGRYFEENLHNVGTNCQDESIWSTSYFRDKRCTARILSDVSTPDQFPAQACMARQMEYIPINMILLFPPRK